MSDVKWIKISTGVFNDECFEIIDDMPEADAIELIWFKLLVFAGKQNNNGLFLFKDQIAYTDEMLSSIFHRPLNVVRLALSTFIQLGMIEQIDGVYAIPNWNKYQNLDAYEAKKIRDKEYSKKYREKQKLLLEDKKSSDESSDDSRFCSYSYSKKSNISNLNYLLDTYKEEYIYITNNNTLLDIIKYWLEYKQDKGKQHLIYAERSLKGLLEKFIEMDKQYGTNGVDKAVKDTVTNGWQGIVWEKAESNNKNKTVARNLFDELRDC